MKERLGARTVARLAIVGLTAFAPIVEGVARTDECSGQTYFDSNIAACPSEDGEGVIVYHRDGRSWHIPDVCDPTHIWQYKDSNPHFFIAHGYQYTPGHIDLETNEVIYEGNYYIPVSFPQKDNC